MKKAWYVGRVPELRGCHSQAKSLDRLMLRTKEAIELCADMEGAVAIRFIGIQRVEVTR
jgi:predicted RNase H-like HicB family nuclease